MRLSWVGDYNKFKKVVIILFLLNVSDIVLTLWQMEIYGMDIEKNMFIAGMVENLGYIMSLVIKTTIGLIVCWYMLWRWKPDMSVEVKRNTGYVLGFVVGCYGLINVLHISNLVLFFLYL